MFPYRLVHQCAEMSQKEPIHFDSLDPAEKSGKTLKEYPIYQDEWSKVFPGKLEITWYYFPHTSSKFINTQDIKCIYYRKQSWKEDFTVAKSWGKAFSNIWWACDMRRDMRCQEGEIYNNIVIDNGESTLKGFTCNNLDAFFAALRPQLPPKTDILNDLPSK